MEESLWIVQLNRHTRLKLFFSLMPLLFLRLPYTSRVALEESYLGVGTQAGQMRHLDEQLKKEVREVCKTG